MLAVFSALLLALASAANVQHPMCTDLFAKDTRFTMKNDQGRNVALYEAAPNTYYYTTAGSAEYKASTGFKGDLWHYTTDGRVCMDTPLKTLCIRVVKEGPWYNPKIVESTEPIRANEWESFDILCDASNNCVFQAIDIKVAYHNEAADQRYLVLNRHESQPKRIKLGVSNGHKAQRFNLTSL